MYDRSAYKSSQTTMWYVMLIIYLVHLPNNATPSPPPNLTSLTSSYDRPGNEQKRAAHENRRTSDTGGALKKTQPQSSSRTSSWELRVRSGLGAYSKIQRTGSDLETNFAVCTFFRCGKLEYSSPLAQICREGLPLALSQVTRS